MTQDILQAVEKPWDLGSDGASQTRVSTDEAGWRERGGRENTSTEGGGGVEQRVEQTV